MKIKLLFALMICDSAFSETQINCSIENIISGVLPVAPRVTELNEASLIFKYLVSKEGTLEDITLVEFEGDERWIKTYEDFLKGRKYKKTKEPYMQTCQFKAVFQ